MDKIQPNKTKIKKNGTNYRKERFHGTVKGPPLKGILSRGKKKGQTKKKKVSFNEIPEVRVFGSDISDDDNTDIACPSSTSSDTAIATSTSSDTVSPVSTASSSASPTRSNSATVGPAGSNLARGNPVRLTPVKVSPTRTKASHAKAKAKAKVSPAKAKTNHAKVMASHARAKAIHARAKASHTKDEASHSTAEASHARAEASNASAKTSNARASSSTTVVGPASIIPASDEPSDLVMTPFSYRFPPPSKATPKDTGETKFLMANLLKELEKSVNAKRENPDYIKRNEIDLTIPNRRRPLPDNDGGGDPPAKKVRKLSCYASSNDDMTTPFDSMVAMLPHMKIFKRYIS